ncbi:MAG: hypothetical protein ABFS19_07955 [Thermodesulfobacteriota bacterium]
MPRKSKYDLNTFRELVKAGKSKSQIMKEMNISGHPQFNSLELRLFKEDKKVYEISAAKQPAVPTVTVSPKKNITIPSKLLAGKSFKAKDKFVITFRGKKIILTKMED